MRNRRTQPFKSRRRFPRFTFDTAWWAAIEALVLRWQPRHRKGTFTVVTAVGELLAHISLPDGRAYSSTLRPHHNHGREWFGGFVSCTNADDAERDQVLNADGILPEIAPPSFNVWPCQMKLSPSRFDGANGSAWFGRLWVSARDGRPGGEVYSIFANAVAEDDVTFRGEVVRYRSR